MKTTALALLLALAFPVAALAQDGDPKPADPKPQEKDPTPPKPPEKAPDPKPEEAKAPEKASLAVMKFSYNEHVTKQEDGTTKRYIEEFDTSILTNKLITSLVNTRKFDVVDRDKIDKLMKEQQFGETGMLDPQRCVKAGKVIGADYFLTGAIAFFTVTQKSVENPYARGQFAVTVTCEIKVDMRIVDTRTSKIVAADTVDASIGTKFNSTSSSRVEVSSKLLDDVQRDLSDKLSTKVIDGIYPVKVVGWKDGVAYLNRGESGGIAKGEIFDVFSLGEALIDPDTGANLGSEEKKVAQIRVTSVEARMSKAESTGAPIASLPRGAICRKAKAVDAAEPKDEPKRGPQGW